MAVGLGGHCTDLGIYFHTVNFIVKTNTLCSLKHSIGSLIEGRQWCICEAV